MKITILQLFSIIILSLCACSSTKNKLNKSPHPSQNAVDSMTKPGTDMRNKTHRSQESPSELDEDEREEEGGIKQGNTA